MAVWRSRRRVNESVFNPFADVKFSAEHPFIVGVLFFLQQHLGKLAAKETELFLHSSLSTSAPLALLSG